MKKLIVTIICVLFASTSFAQMVGASSIAKQSTPKTTLGVKKHEFSIHGGVGNANGIRIYNHNIYGIFSLKYKFTPSKLNNFRVFGEVKLETDNYENIFIGNYLCTVGINLEKRIDNTFSYWMEIGTGIGFYSYGGPRCILSSEIGIAIADLLLGLNYQTTWLYDNMESILSLRLGYRF